MTCIPPAMNGSVRGGAVGTAELAYCAAAAVALSLGRSRRFGRSLGGGSAWVTS